jgi:hypothetical protein
MSGDAAPSHATRQRVRRQIIMVALVAIAPIVASYLAYYAWPRDTKVNYGSLLATPAPVLTGRTLDGQAFRLADLRGRWVLLTASGGTCDAACEASLYAGRQARTIQNAERERVVRVWLITDRTAPAKALLEEHPDLVAAHASASEVGALPGAGHALYLIDPLGNLVLSWPPDPDIKRMARDITRLLRASSIG